MVILFSLAILLFWTLLGLPLSLLCRRDSYWGCHLLLAPSCGLAILAIITTNAYFLNVPVSRTVLPMLGLCLLSAGVSIAGLVGIMGSRRESAPDRTSLIAVLRRNALIPALLLGVTCLVHSLPFILKPGLVFYAYSGTDAYAYMTVAEYQLDHGLYDRPTPDIYRPWSALTAHLTDPESHIDKPGTMTTLAFFSGLFSKLPHEAFSPLMISAVLLLYPCVLALAQRLGFPVALAAFAGLLSTLSLPVLALSSNQYLAATMTLALLPAILVLAADALVSPRVGMVFAIVCTAYFLVSPPSFLIPVAATSLYLAYSAVHCIRTSAKAFWISAASLLASFLGLSALTLKAFPTAELRWVFAPAQPMDPVLRRWSWGLFWHTLGVGPIIASAATTLDAPALVGLGCIVLLGIVYLGRSIARRDFSTLFFSYLSFWLVVILGGVGGVLRSFPAFPRVSQQFAPLHPLVYLSLLHDKDLLSRKGWLRRGGPILIPLLVVIMYPLRPFLLYEKESLVDNPQRTNQYDRGSLRARDDIGRIVGESRLFLSSSIPTHVGAINIAALFSHARLTMPPEYLRLFQPHHAPTPENYFCAPTLLSSDFYADISGTNDKTILYHSNGFRLSAHDLVLLFDNETFEIKNKRDVQVLARHSLVQARTLQRDTVVHVCSEAGRRVRLTFTYTPLNDDVAVALGITPAIGTQRVVFTRDGNLTTPPFALREGVNRIRMVPEAAGRGVEILGMVLRPG